MRKLIGFIASSALIAVGLVTAGATSSQAATCDLDLRDYMYNGANTLMYSARMIGCEADAYVEIQTSPNETGPFVVKSDDWKGTQHLTQEWAASWFDGNCLDLWVRVYMKYGDQEQWTHAAINSNANSNCG